MEQLTIVRPLCIGCARCVQTCPMGIPVMGADGIARVNPNNAEVCIYCGQCVAACPTGALSLNAFSDHADAAELASYGIVPLALDPQNLRSADVGDLPSPAQLDALIASRRSVRAFRPDLVDHAVIDHLVHDVLTHAPTGHNVRGLKATVIEGRDKLDQLTELSVAFFDRLVDDESLHSFDRKVFARINTAWREQQIDRVFRQGHQAIILSCQTSIPPRDPAIMVMLSYFQLAALTRGIGTVWAGYFMIAAGDPAIKQVLGVGPEESIHGAVTFGYPQWDFPRIPARPDITLHYR